MKLLDRPSPNFDDRQGQAVDMLVLHYTGMRSAAEALQRLCDPEAKVSAHYVVDEDGTVYRLVAEDKRAWHAGVSSWRGNTNINQRSIGIEIVNPGHEFGYRPFPHEQMVAVAELCREILARHAIAPRNVVAHSDVAPTRKEDPGELFDWKWLASQGIGIWPEISAMDRLRGTIDWWLMALSVLTAGYTRYGGGYGRAMRQRAIAYRTLMHQLAAYGYENPSMEQEKLDVWRDPYLLAFQRHFRPKKLTGRWDGECQAILTSLLKNALV